MKITQAQATHHTNFSKAGDWRSCHIYKIVDGKRVCHLCQCQGDPARMASPPIRAEGGRVSPNHGSALPACDGRGDRPWLRLRLSPARCCPGQLAVTHDLLVPDILLLLTAARCSCSVPATIQLYRLETNQIKMENIGTGGGELAAAGAGLGPGLHHSSYSCDIRHPGHAGLLHPAHHAAHLALQDREKSFSVNHLLELPGQGQAGHMYHDHPLPLPDSVVSDLQRVDQSRPPEHHRLSSQQLKLPEG